MSYRTITTFLTIGCGFLFMYSTEAFAGNQPTERLKNFTAVEVENFENPKFATKEPMPDEWIPLMREDVVQRLIEKHLFRNVQDFTDEKVKAPEKERALIVRGKILQFTKGSQAKRYLVGFGAGAGKIVVLCTVVDKETGKVIWEDKVDGKVIGFGQDSQGAIKGVSKELAKKLASIY